MLACTPGTGLSLRKQVTVPSHERWLFPLLLFRLFKLIFSQPGESRGCCCAGLSGSSMLGSRSGGCSSLHPDQPHVGYSSSQCYAVSHRRAVVLHSKAHTRPPLRAICTKGHAWARVTRPTRSVAYTPASALQVATTTAGCLEIGAFLTC